MSCICTLFGRVTCFFVQIHWMGKPDPVIYDVALDILNIPKEHILAVGDSLQHDIQGWAHDISASTVSHAPGGIL